MKHEVMVPNRRDLWANHRMGLWIVDNLQLKYLQDWKYELTYAGHVRYLFADEQAAIMFSLRWS